MGESGRYHGYYMTGVDPKNRTITVRNPWGWNYSEITLTYEQFAQHFGGETGWNPTK